MDQVSWILALLCTGKSSKKLCNQSKNTEGNITIKRKLRQRKRNDLLPHFPLDWAKNRTIWVWKSHCTSLEIWNSLGTGDGIPNLKIVPVIKDEVVMSRSSRWAFLLNTEDWQSYWQPWARFAYLCSYLHENAVQRGHRIYCDILEAVLHPYFSLTKKWLFKTDGSGELAGTIKS